MTTPSIYVHVPFCRSRCSYCSFVSYTGDDPLLQTRVIGKTLEQAAWWAERLGGLGPRTVYIGGGTPSFLQPAALEVLLGGLDTHFAARPVEYTIEANPDSITAEFLSICHGHGVNRLSLGIQTFSAQARRSAGRLCRDPDIESCHDLVRDRWPGAVSLDLIAGFSSQQAGDVVRDVELAAGWAPDHVSLYALTLEGHQGGLKLSEQADELWLEGFDRLEEVGYPNYEVCNFARPGKECRHNLVYWSLNPYLGIGPSAVSTVPGEGGAALRIQTPPDLAVFLEGGVGTALEGAEQLSAHDLLFESLIMGLRLRDGLDLSLLEGRLGRPIASILPRTLSGWADRSLLADLPGRLALTKAGRLVLDALLVEAREEIDVLAPGSIGFRWP